MVLLVTADGFFFLRILSNENREIKQIYNIKSLSFFVLAKSRKDSPFLKKRIVF